MRLAVASRRRSRPSLIPLIDVMLVLLFFFMLATTYTSYGRTRLELAAGVGAGSADEGTVTRVVLDDGRLRIGDRVLPAEQAIAELRTASEVRLSPAPGVALQTLLAGWETLKGAGIAAQLAEARP